ncbi:MAG: hydroxyacylglutathione hydrolase [Betaproteobacteria bacterium]|nr:hydroxyacylglutathione hydrolase [Betaproteobacteria bacterium]MBK7742458.1 hydroxyacylglutathione hydrolase [Betaproteobacteria bacterium]
MPAIIPIPAFSDNYIWLLRAGGHAAVVDPGDADPVLLHLDREGLRLAAILVTHHHGDHTGGIAALLARFPVPVLGPARERIGGRTQALADGDVARVPALGLALDVIDVPGHTAGHVAYTGVVAGAPVAFVGDTLFGGGCGRLFEGTPAQMAHSLARLAELPGNTRVYCAHEYTLSNLRFARVVEPGNDALAARQAREQQRRDRGQPTVPMTLDDERATNPFLRAAVPAVAAAATAWAGRPLPDDVAVFAALREWKNGFR